ICQLTDVGSLVAKTGLFEIFTPYKKQTNEPFFEQAQIYPVYNAGTSSRMYSALTGSLGGDVTLFSRQNASVSYVTEAMSPTDRLYQLWFTNAGRPNFIDRIGPAVKRSSIAFSNSF